MKHTAPLLLSLLMLSSTLFAQQAPTAPHGRALTHDDYESWNSLRGTAYSHDGKWIAYQVEPVFGDGELIIRQTDGDVEYRRGLASSARFSADSRFVAFTVGKSKVAAREKKIADLRKQGKSEQGAGAPESQDLSPLVGEVVDELAVLAVLPCQHLWVGNFEVVLRGLRSPGPMTNEEVLENGLQGVPVHLLQFKHRGVDGLGAVTLEDRHDLSEHLV